MEKATPKSKVIDLALRIRQYVLPLILGGKTGQVNISININTGGLSGSKVSFTEEL